MKIDGTSIGPIGSIQATNRVVSLDKKIAEQEKGKAGEDGVKVSDKAQVFQTLLKKAQAIPEVREDRVREITERINKGEFKVDAQLISDKLLGQNSLSEE